MRTRTPSLRPLYLSRISVLRHLANRNSRPAASIVVLALVLLLLAACGPSQSKPDVSQAEAETLRIAQTYQSNGDREQARAGIDALAVANPRQYLALRAELAIADGADTQETAALVKLAVDLGTASGTVHEYAAKNGLAAPTPTFEPVVQAQTAATLIPLAAAAAPATPTAVAPVAAEIAVSSASPVTSPATTPLTTTVAATPSALALALPTPTALASEPMAAAAGVVNVRGGPGTEYDVVGALQPAAAVEIIGKDMSGAWWEVQLAPGQTGWVLSQLVQTSGDTGAVVTEANIPAPPPTSTPAPVAAATSAPAEASAPVATEAGAPAAAEAATAAAPAASPSDKPSFKVISKRMWSKAENGACSGQHLLRINVVDANGVRINGVRLKGIYTGEIMVTGSQGKGDGVIEYDLYGTGEGFKVIQNDDGREVDSESAEGFTTKSLDIPMPTLIEGGYCSNEADCQIFYNSYGCTGHHSWEATFQRNY